VKTKVKVIRLTSHRGADKSMPNVTMPAVSPSNIKGLAMLK
jgi:hypothetical protein